MSNFVFVLETNRKPLTPCTPGMARSLLKAGKAAVFRQYPFTIILNKEVQATPEPLTLKLDPGSKTTGLAILINHRVIWAAELTHRGQQIKDSLQSRRAIRRNRRNRKTRYRPARFLNRTRPDGWLAPSLQHRVETTITWVNRISRFAPVSSIVQELIRFDLQFIQNPEISGVEYQQGELQGYEVREYLLNKFNRQCAYCGAKDTALEVEHIQPRSRGGSDRVSNLTLACHPCNQRKGNQDVKDFLSGKPDVLKRVLAQAKTPFKDAAAVNTTRWALFNALNATGKPVATGSGGLTKFNRTRLGLPKTHWLDAACVGNTPMLEVLTTQPLQIKATGHGTRQMCRTDRFGFPSRYVPRFKFVQGFQTGDIVKAIVTSGKKIGVYVGRVAVRSSGSFNVSTAQGLVQGVSHKYCTPIHKKDGYAYGY
ncbi:MAG: HNH endonuclease [Cyanobacteria bacterium CRU_2_1]|nr:HNH endonuclease [Cyanobacteria bacterium RU_5_0]NJR62640.1 HNH endonuclease [Cyanobacteria bacterium CRU_2_1]